MGTRKEYSKVCLQCGLDFTATRFWQKFCSQKCLSQYHNAKKPKPEYPGIPPTTVGAIGELQVAVDLMARGFEVFRALSASCPCDLIALKGEKMFRIESRINYGNLPKNGEPPTLKRDEGRQDFFAFITPNGIEYKPLLPCD